VFVLRQPNDCSDRPIAVIPPALAIDPIADVLSNCRMSDGILEKWIAERGIECAVGRASEESAPALHNTSCFGGLPWLPRGTEWPVRRDVPMIPLITVVTAELPSSVSSNLRGIASFTVFAEPSDTWLEPSEKFNVVASANGCQTYRPSSPHTDQARAQFITWSSAIDFPCASNYCTDMGLVNPGLDFFKEWEVACRSHPNHDLKVGGWPNTETFYLAQRPSDYVLQIGALCPLAFVQSYCDGGSLFLLHGQRGWTVEFCLQ
jgi:hypothetical protein